MSELKAHHFCEIDEFFREYHGPLSNEMHLYYLKSEADKVIAELEADIVKLKSSLKYLVVRGLIDGPVKKAAEDVLKEVEDAH